MVGHPKVIAHDGVGYLKACLKSLLYQPDIELFDIFISLDEPKVFVEFCVAARVLKCAIIDGL